MLTETFHALERFDNAHDFERMCADILNALGFKDVEPMAPGGGSDGGIDIRFREGDLTGVAMVTLDKGVAAKFARDLEKQAAGNSGTLVFFCNAVVTPRQKLDFATAASTKGYRLQIYDIEALRSILDASLKDIRKRYLHIDDDVSLKIRGDVKRLLRFPEAGIETRARASTALEGILNPLPRRLFDVLIQYDEGEIKAIPIIGSALHKFMIEYHAFRTTVRNAEVLMLSKIGTLARPRFAEAWRILLKYTVLRTVGLSPQEIAARGDFLNYDITWSDAEHIYQTIMFDPATLKLEEALEGFKNLQIDIEKITANCGS